MIPWGERNILEIHVALLFAHVSCGKNAYLVLGVFQQYLALPAKYVVFDKLVCPKTSLHFTN